MKEYGFIGVGNMAGAMIGGILRSRRAEASQIIGSCRSPKSRDKAQALYKIAMTGDNREVAKEAKILFLCVKPQFLDGVIGEIREVIRPDQLIVSIVAGRSLSYFQKELGSGIRLIRLMPNTPALVGEGMTAACASESVSEEEMQTIADLCGTFGRFEAVPERLFDVVTAVSGSSPAYVFMMMEAMADAAVLGGESIPESSRIWSAPPQARRSKRSGFSKREAFAPQLWRERAPAWKNLRL